jgi:two-component system OmpR family sensor kinase
MRRLTLRARFVALAALLVLAVGTGVGAAGYLTLRHALFEQAERQAREQARQLGGLIDLPRGEQDGNRVDIGDPALTHEFMRPGLIVRIERGDGRLLQGSPSSGSMRLPSALRADCAATGAAAGRLARPALAVACRRVSGPRPALGLIVVGAPLRDAHGLLAALRNALVVGVLAGVVLAGALAAALARRALRPARSIAAAAASIRAGNLGRRIGYRGPRDELGTLADELDACFAELEDAVERQRRFVADASHELKTPIAAIRAHAELLHGWAGLDPGAREAALSSLEQVARRASRLLADLLYLARLDREPPARRVAVRLDQVTLDVVREAQPLRPEVAIRIERLDEVEVHGDELRLQQLLLNLLDNALRISPSGSAVSVAVASSDARASVRVSDHGPGLPPEVAERIFDRFYSRLPPEARGTGGLGLGLTIARKIADDHGGSLTVSRANQGGAVFTATLPLPPGSSNPHRALSALSPPTDTVAHGTRREVNHRP